MKQFAIHNGDLVLGPGGYATVSGPSKARQDLAHALREPIGNDRFHPSWGSTLPSLIGQVANPAMVGTVQSEVYRVVRNYIISRLALIQQDVQDGNAPKFSASEIVQAVTDIKIRQDGDKYLVLVVLRTLGDELISIPTTVEA